MTCGCGLSVFISSSSDFKSRLSDSRAFAVGINEWKQAEIKETLKKFITILQPIVLKRHILIASCS